MATHSVSRVLVLAPLLVILALCSTWVLIAAQACRLLRMQAGCLRYVRL